MGVERERIMRWMPFLALAGCTVSSPLLETTPSASCEDGGYTVRSGLDENGDGVLQAGEVTSEHDLCNGADGTDGTPGEPGTSPEEGPCAGVAPLFIANLAGEPVSLLVRDRFLLRGETNSLMPERLVGSLVGSGMPFEITPAALGGVDVEVTAPAFYSASYVYMISDGCSTAFQQVEFRGVDVERAPIRLVNASLDLIPAVDSAEGEFGLTERLVSDLAPAGQAERREVFANELEISVDDPILATDLTPNTSYVGILTHDDSTELELVEVLPGTTGVATVQLLHRADDLARFTPWVDGSAVGTAFGYGDDRTLTLSPGAATLELRGTFDRYVQLPELIDGEAYTLVLGDALRQEAMLASAESDDIVSSLTLLTELPLPQPSDASLEVLGGDTSGWIAYDNDDTLVETSTSWRSFTIPGAARIQVDLNYDLEPNADFLVAEDGAGAVVLSSAARISGVGHLALNADGDTLRIAVQANGANDSSNGFQGWEVGQITWEAAP